MPTVCRPPPPLDPTSGSPGGPAVRGGKQLRRLSHPIAPHGPGVLAGQQHLAGNREIRVPSKVAAIPLTRLQHRSRPGESFGQPRLRSAPESRRSDAMIPGDSPQMGQTHRSDTRTLTPDPPPTAHPANQYICTMLGRRLLVAPSQQPVEHRLHLQRHPPEHHTTLFTAPQHHQLHDRLRHHRLTEQEAGRPGPAHTTPRLAATLEDDRIPVPQRLAVVDPQRHNRPLLCPHPP